jgi:hypothetical protein
LHLRFRSLPEIFHYHSNDLWPFDNKKHLPPQRLPFTRSRL